MVSMDRLIRRADFIAAAGATRAPGSAFLTQARDRRDRGAARIGYTVTKKTGNAVERNRIRRRLRQAARDVVPRLGQEGYDYVLIARRAALAAPYALLVQELERALGRLHRAQTEGRDG
jgi:ribonuclease P protein component